MATVWPYHRRRDERGTRSGGRLQSSSLLPHAPDSRQHARGTFNVSRDGRPTLSANDVASLESGLLFGGGWFLVEGTREGRKFRWAADGAEVLLPPARKLGDDSSGRGRRQAGCRGAGGGSGGRAAGAAEIDRRGWIRRWPRRCRRKSCSARRRKARWPNWICAAVLGSSASTGSNGCRRNRGRFAQASILSGLGSR